MQPIPSHGPQPGALPDDDAQRATCARALALIAAALSGFGLVMWVAANWALWSRSTHFALLLALLAISGGAAWALWRWRAPSVAFALLAVLGTGALFAYFGQTYQTGADVWQLFALWALLALPLALGVRSQWVWLPWALVANAAISLWDWSQYSWVQDVPLWVLLWATALTMGLAAALHPAWQQRTGSGMWSARAAMLLALGMSATLALLHYFGHNASGGTAGLWLGVLALVAAAALLAQRRFYDVLGLSAAALALMTVLLAFAATEMLRDMRQDFAFALLLLGVLAAAALSGSVYAIMQLHKRMGEAPAGADAGAGAGAHTPPRLPCEATAAGRPWAVVALTALGAWLAVVPLALFLFMQFERAQPFIWVVVGVTVIAGGLVLLRTLKTDHLFAEQLLYAALVLGMVVMTYGAWDLWGWQVAMGAVLAVMLAAVASVPQHWLVLLLGAAVCALLPVWLLGVCFDAFMWLPARRQGLSGEGSLSQWLALAVALAWPLHEMFSPWRTPRAKAFMTGWAVYVLLQQAMMAGQTFLLGAFMPLHDTGSVTGTGWTGIGVWQFGSVLFAAAGCAVLLHHRPALRHPAFVLLCALWTAASWWLPTLGVALGFALMALAFARRGLAVLALLAVAWVVGAAYYLSLWPLLHKALSLMALGMVMAALAAWLHKDGRRTVAAASRAAPAAPMPWPWLRHGLLLGTLGACAVAGQGVWHNEALIAHGEKLFVALAPVDPRSLMQGDYMRLRFDLFDRAASLSQAQADAQAMSDAAVADAAAAGQAASEADISAPGAGLSERSASTPAAADAALPSHGAQPAASEASPEPPETDATPATIWRDGNSYPARAIVMRRDARGVAHALRFEHDLSAPPPLAADERRLLLQRKNAQPMLVTDAWYFREGTAKLWEKAAYGEFRVLPNGRALLVGMADAQLQPIGDDAALPPEGAR